MLARKTYLSLAVGLLCLQLLVPGVFWHSLSGHHDTGHCELPEGTVQVGEQHLHCPALDLVLQAGTPEHLVFLFTDSGLLYIFRIPETLHQAQLALFYHFLRGPPCLLH